MHGAGSDPCPAHPPYDCHTCILAQGRADQRRRAPSCDETSHFSAHRSRLVCRLRRRAPATQRLAPAPCLNFLLSFMSSTNSHGSATTIEQILRPGCKRLSGPPLPPNGTPTPTPSLESLNERLERLAFGERAGDQPPLVTYTATPTAHGDVVKATPEFIAWMGRKVPGYGGQGARSVSVPRGASQGEGEKRSPLAHFLQSP
jgi:hypothetical protein